MKEDIYKLKLHETLTIELELSEYNKTNVIVMRVPGGWTYGKVFVPYNAEFLIRKESPKDKLYVIAGRNKENSIFSVADMDSYLEGSGAYWLSAPEERIVEMMENGYIFLTHDKKGDRFTPIYAYRGEIRTIPNETTEDNIGNLPIIG